ncbi:MAG: trypsin-like peptidase domain-containing protein [Clostridia bacterium]|nr:trypsin-like peptidase domain-containing protein [Clostridia bacterium]
MENENIKNNENKEENIRKQKIVENNATTNQQNFKSVTNQPKVKKQHKEKTKKNNTFGKTVVIPFISGVLGCSAVLGTILLVPDIKKAVFPENPSYISTAPSNSTSSDGTVKQVDLEKYSNTSVYAANKILPSIVGIKVEYTVSSNLFMFGNTPQTSSASATGSGIIISDDGYILTNNHIVSTSSSESYYEVSDANKVTVTLYNDETEYEAKIIGKDEQTDLAVIKIDKDGLSKAEFADSDSIKVGEFAMAVGNPLGMQSSITCGVISAVNRDVTDSDGKTFTLIQTDAAINAGNSGGALVNSEGKVIGINTLKLSGTGVEGIGFAIPINSTTDITSQLIQYSKVKRPFIGITGVDLDEKTAKVYNLVVGVYVKRVEDFSAAERSGLKIGDVIIEVEGNKINSMDELNKIKNSKKIGDELKIKVNRNGKEQDLTITLGEQP